MFFFRIWHLFWIIINITSIYFFNVLNCIWDYIDICIVFGMYPVLIVLSFNKKSHWLKLHKYKIIIIEFLVFLLLAWLSIYASFGFNVG
jgi:hypothetical protein